MPRRTATDTRAANAKRGHKPSSAHVQDERNHPRTGSGSRTRPRSSRTAKISDDRLADELRARFFDGSDRQADLIVILAVRRGPQVVDGSTVSVSAIEILRNMIDFSGVLGVDNAIPQDIAEALLQAATPTKPDKPLADQVSEAVEFGARVVPKAKLIAEDIAGIVGAFRGRRS